jgi:beta-glucosidase
MEQADAMLEIWFPGTEGGNAVADVLFGDYNPSGKLAMSFPRSIGQLPVYYAHLNTGRPYSEGKPGNYTSHYYEEPNGALFPFGYGLSYTRFDLSEIKLSQASMARKGKLTASVTVKNTGKVAGATVVQLYLRDIAASISRPVKELKNFEKVTLEPGQEKVVSFTLSEDDLKFYNAQLKYAAEPGEFRVMIGLDSSAVKEATFNLL